MTPIDVLTAGEAMVMLAPHGPLGEADAVDLRVGGAEANVACFLAAAGRPTAWLGALGADPFGDRVQAHLERYGVDTRHVRRDPGRPTGLYAKDPSPTGETAVWYYRRGSAASGMGPDAAAAVARCAPRVVHLSGITPALSQAADALCRALLAEARRHGARVSFDVNHRPGLWEAARAAPILRAYAAAADIVFVGRDEAARLWGTTTPAEAARAIGAAHTVVKDADIGATSFRAGAEPVFVAAPAVDVVEPVGAGDAFAAGYLHALLGGVDDAGAADELDESSRLQSGHRFSALALGDHADVPPPDVIRRRLGVAAGWTNGAQPVP